MDLFPRPAAIFFPLPPRTVQPMSLSRHPWLRQFARLGRQDALRPEVSNNGKPGMDLRPGVQSAEPLDEVCQLLRLLLVWRVRAEVHHFIANSSYIVESGYESSPVHGPP